MFGPKFSLLSLLAMISLVCLGLGVYEVASQPQLPAMPNAPRCPCGQVSDPLERVYIAGPSADSQDINYSPNF